jgi:hypothetical protein
MYKALYTGALIFAIAVTTATGCKSNAGDCAGLDQEYQTDIKTICSSRMIGPSRYCKTCVSAGLYSYLTSTSGTCTCWPLVLTGGICAGTEDHEALVNAVASADRECSSFVVGDGGVALTTDASVRF